jgi:hypothetical protein
VLAAAQQLATAAFDFFYGTVQGARFGELEAEMPDPAALAGVPCSLRIGIQRDQIMAARHREKHHVRPAPKLLVHAEYLAVEPHRALEVAHGEMNVVQPTRVNRGLLLPRNLVSGY